MRIATLATAIWLTLLGTIALAQTTTYDYDRGANFSIYKTYAWTRGAELERRVQPRARRSSHRCRLGGEGARARGDYRQPQHASRLPREFRQ